VGITKDGNRGRHERAAPGWPDSLRTGVPSGRVPGVSVCPPGHRPHAPRGRDGLSVRRRTASASTPTAAGRCSSAGGGTTTRRAPPGWPGRDNGRALRSSSQGISVVLPTRPPSPRTT
jgi:hypothetical protein